jgi:hypothetical protein
MNNTSYELKYLKYKKKYLEIKRNKSGGSASERDGFNREAIINELRRTGNLRAVLRDPQNSRLRDDKEIVLTAVMTNGGQLRFASERLQNDRDIVLAAVTNDGNSLVNASIEIQFNDIEIISAAIINNGNVISNHHNAIYDNYQHERKDYLLILALNSLHITGRQPNQETKDLIVLELDRIRDFIENILNGSSIKSLNVSNRLGADHFHVPDEVTREIRSFIHDESFKFNRNGYYIHNGFHTIINKEMIDRIKDEIIPIYLEVDEDDDDDNEPYDYPSDVEHDPTTDPSSDLFRQYGQLDK